MKDLIDALGGSVGILIIILMIALIFWAIYDEHTSDKFELKKDEWACSLTSTRTVIQMISYDGGKTQTPIPVIQNYCTQWTKK